MSFVIIGSILYALPICFIRRFHTPLNLLTLSLSVALFMCTTFWTIYFVMNTFYTNRLWTEKSCLVIIYLQTIVNGQFVNTLCSISLNRLFAIVYPNKAFFRTKTWVAICMCIQLIYGLLIPLPQFASNITHCLLTGLEIGYQIYVLVINAIIPLVFLTIINSIIFISVRRSTRRVHNTNSEHQESANTLNQRDARLLKHMLFMLITFLGGWIPMYIIAVIDWNGDGISYIALHTWWILPMLSFIINMCDLFMYNHELRSYITTKLRNRPSR
ncbi:unnamed protein product [Rotaria sp. Silwood2]|nr:unnamed protein product [Rotaria sp. Silwood2]CAF3146302.1 unnamed protein product [Rotaria sp. Silwood2]CAF3482541.1 unnamed protein product [Rotaria sp. Silwood2]CAF4506017.1 unnamed protein product [Rotaria sp. Silwood2]CAF4575873.1 unnamed protein product [Rotaria sp. Silwood2]